MCTIQKLSNVTKNNRKGWSINDMTFHRVYWILMVPIFSPLIQQVLTRTKIKDGQKIMN